MPQRPNPIKGRGEKRYSSSLPLLLLALDPSGSLTFLSGAARPEAGSEALNLLQALNEVGGSPRNLRVRRGQTSPRPFCPV